MIKWLTAVFLFTFVSCTDSAKELHGDWKANSRQYKATSRIFEENHQLKGLILSYDDGTTRFKADGKTKRYLFENLKQQDDVFLDGITGATVKEGEVPAISIQQISRDTLSVTTYVLHQPTADIWTRIK